MRGSCDGKVLGNPSRKLSIEEVPRFHQKARCHVKQAAENSAHLPPSFSLHEATIAPKFRKKQAGPRELQRCGKKKKSDKPLRTNLYVQTATSKNLRLFFNPVHEFPLRSAIVVLLTQPLSKLFFKTISYGLHMPSGDTTRCNRSFQNVVSPVHHWTATKQCTTEEGNVHALQTINTNALQLHQGQTSHKDAQEKKNLKPST